MNISKLEGVLLLQPKDPKQAIKTKEPNHKPRNKPARSKKKYDPTPPYMNGIVIRQPARYAAGARMKPLHENLRRLKAKRNDHNKNCKTKKTFNIVAEKR